MTQALNTWPPQDCCSRVKLIFQRNFTQKRKVHTRAGGSLHSWWGPASEIREAWGCGTPDKPRHLQLFSKMGFYLTLPHRVAVKIKWGNGGNLLASCLSDSKCLISINCYHWAIFYSTHFMIALSCITDVCVTSVSNLMDSSKRGGNAIFLSLCLPGCLTQCSAHTGNSCW